MGSLRRQALQRQYVALCCLNVHLIRSFMQGPGMCRVGGSGSLASTELPSLVQYNGSGKLSGRISHLAWGVHVLQVWRDGRWYCPRGGSLCRHREWTWLPLRLWYWRWYVTRRGRPLKQRLHSCREGAHARLLQLLHTHESLYSCHCS